MPTVRCLIKTNRRQRQLILGKCFRLRHRSVNLCKVLVDILNRRWVTVPSQVARHRCEVFLKLFRACRRRVTRARIVVIRG